jgi:hypothetical protein
MDALWRFEMDAKINREVDLHLPISMGSNEPQESLLVGAFLFSLAAGRGKPLHHTVPYPSVYSR